MYMQQRKWITGEKCKFNLIVNSLFGYVKTIVSWVIHYTVYRVKTFYRNENYLIECIGESELTDWVDFLNFTDSRELIYGEIPPIEHLYWWAIVRYGINYTDLFDYGWPMASNRLAIEHSINAAT